MTIQSAFSWGAPDSTELLNRRLNGLVPRGIYSGGWLTPVAGTLTAARGPFLAMSYDGMTIFDLASETFTYAANATYYHVILAKYNTLGTPATPIIQEYVLTESVYNAHADKAYMIVFAKVTVPLGATQLLSSYIDYSVRDVIDPMCRFSYRGVVASTGSLPVDTLNRTGDVYLVNNENTLYRWNGSAWVQLVAKGASTLDGAYDDDGSSPGAGRTITADAGAVEIIQTITGSYSQDVANAPLRLRKGENTTVDGDVGIDVIFSKGVESAAALLVRERLVVGTSIQKDEPINVSGSTVTFTRVGVNLQVATKGNTGFLVQLLEVTGGTACNGLYLVDSIPSANSCTLKNLTAGTVSLAPESGVVGNVFFARLVEGGSQSRALYSKLGRNSGNVEFLGEPDGSSGTLAGRTLLWSAGALGRVLDFRRLNSGSVEEVVVMTPDGCLNIKPSSTTQANNCYEGQGSNPDYNVAYFKKTGVSTSGKAVLVAEAANASFGMGPAIIGKGSGYGAGVYGDGWPGPGVEGNSFALKTDNTIIVPVPLTDFSPVEGKWEIWNSIATDGKIGFKTNASAATIVCEFCPPRGSTITQVLVHCKSAVSQTFSGQIAAYKKTTVAPLANPPAITYGSMYDASLVYFPSAGTEALVTLPCNQNNTYWEYANDDGVVAASTEVSSMIIRIYGGTLIPDYLYGVWVKMTTKSVCKYTSYLIP